MELWIGWGIWVFFSMYLIITAISQLPYPCQVEYEIRYGAVEFSSILVHCLELFPRYCRLAMVLYANVVGFVFRLFWVIGLFLFFVIFASIFYHFWGKEFLLVSCLVMIAFSLLWAVMILCDACFRSDFGENQIRKCNRD
jgi:hypothetical protein